MNNLQTKELETNNRIGFKVKIFGKYLKTTKGSERVLGNLELAKAIAYANGAKSDRDFEVEFVVYKNRIPFEYIQKINNHYEFFGETNGQLVRFIIKEESITEYNNFGYIVFDNGDNERVNKEIGIKRNRALRNILISSIEKIALRTGTVSDINVYDRGVTVSFFNTTSKLSFVNNNEIMEINQWRRELDTENKDYKACFPYLKYMDKFTTFYSFTSKELYESSIAENSRIHLPKDFRDMIMGDLMENWSEYNNKKSVASQVEPKYVSATVHKLNGKILSTKK